MSNTWFFIADRSRAAVYTPNADGSLQKLHDFDEPAVRAHASELTTGKPGRRADDGTPHRSAMERQTSVQQTEVDRFVASIVDWLHHAADGNAFDKLAIVAGPQMLGELKAHLTKPTEHKLVGTLDKDYTHSSPKDLAKHLHTHFPELLTAPSDTVPAAARAGNQQPH